MPVDLLPDGTNPLHWPLLTYQQRWNMIFTSKQFHKKIQWICSLTHWGRVTHICVGNLIINGSDNGLSPGRRQPIIWTNAGILLIGRLGSNFNEILSKILTFKKIRLNVLSAKWRPFCLGLNLCLDMTHKISLPHLPVSIMTKIFDLHSCIPGGLKCKMHVHECGTRFVAFSNNH